MVFSNVGGSVCAVIAATSASCCFMPCSMAGS
jgi:hypothetical protein